MNEYECSNGHAVAAPHELTECPVHGCHGTLALRPRRGRRRKERAKVPAPTEPAPRSDE